MNATTDREDAELLNVESHATAGKITAMAAWAAGTSDENTQAAFDRHPEWRHA